MAIHQKEVIKGDGKSSTQNSWLGVQSDKPRIYNVHYKIVMGKKHKPLNKG